MLSVSVIIPVYQSSCTIREALDSVLSQSIPVNEIIVVDDGSTDDLDEILGPYESKILHLKQENSGASAARNNGIRHATGEIIAFLDADDIWLSNKLECQLPLFSDPEVGVVFGNVFFMHKSMVNKRTYFDLYKPHRGYILPELFEQNFIPMLSVIIRREILISHEFLFNPNLRNVQDYDLLLRLAKDIQFDFVKNPIGIYRISEKQISRNFVKAAEELLDIKTKTYQSNIDLFFNNKNYLDKGLYNKYLRLALCYLREGQFNLANSIIGEYGVKRGKNIKFFLFRILLSSPSKLVKKIIQIRDKIYQKPDLGYY